jgi:Uma2 family endonuclease
MGAAKAVRPLGLEEYLALEREAPVKHELLEGFPHTMAGASDRHNRVVVNLVLVLVLALGPLAREKGRVEVRSRSGRSFTLP